MSLYDESYSCAVVVEKEIVLESKSVLQGILLLTFMYCVYGYNYHTEQTSCLEFVQR